MLLSASVLCPFCGQSSELEIDQTSGDQSFVTDCEVCCRPMEVRVMCEDGAVSEVLVTGAG